MSDERLVLNVAPIGRDHQPGRECWCEPILGLEDTGHEILVHRTSPAPIDMVLDSLAPTAWEPRHGG